MLCRGGGDMMRRPLAICYGILSLHNTAKLQSLPNVSSYIAQTGQVSGPEIQRRAAAQNAPSLSASWPVVLILHAQPLILEVDRLGGKNYIKLQL